MCKEINGQKKLFGSAIILAGGKSSRMGFDKQFIEINEKRLIEITAGKLGDTFDEIIIVTNRPEMYKESLFRVTSDIIHGKGPLCGIHAGLAAAASEFVYVLACDMPYINIEYIKHMKGVIETRLQASEGADACITLKGEWIEPFNAFYRKSLVTKIEEHLESDKRAVFSLLKQLDTVYISELEARRFSPDWSMFFNMNTIEELRRYSQVTQEGKPNGKIQIL